MAFDKAEYRRRRNEGKRGQDDPIKFPVIENPKGILNRRQSRRKTRQRMFGPGLPPEGVTHTRKGAPHRNRNNLRPFSEHKAQFDPEVSNHQRVVGQRKRSGRYREDRVKA